MPHQETMLKKAKRILEKEEFIEGADIMPLGFTKDFNKGISRYEFKVFLKSNTGEVEREYYLNIFSTGSHELVLKD